MNCTTIRDSSFELLKILAMMIVLSHSMAAGNQMYQVDIWNATYSPQVFLLILLKWGGQLGDAIFVICSTWFLVDNNEVKWKKVFSIFGNTIFISYVFLVIFLLMGYNLDKGTIIKQLMPLTFENLWFITCYIALYIIHPVINLWINNVSENNCKKAVFGLGGILYSGVYPK